MWVFPAAVYVGLISCSVLSLNWKAAWAIGAVGGLHTKKGLDSYQEFLWLWGMEVGGRGAPMPKGRDLL